MRETVVRTLIAALLALGLAACQTSPSVTPSAAPASIPNIAAATALPAGVIDPDRLMRQIVGMTSTVQRVDRITAKLVSWDDFMKDSGAFGSAPQPAARVWAVAVIGSIRIDSIMDLPNATCGVWAFDAGTGEVQSMRAGPATTCAGFFDR